MNQRTYYLVAVAVLMLIVGGLLFFRGKPTYTASYTPYDAALGQNATVAQADAAYQAGDYALAQKAYSSALGSAADSLQKADLSFLIAMSKDLSGDHTGAISDLKGIIADPLYDASAKAYAAQYIARMPSMYPSDALSIMQTIFSDAPYSGMRISTSTTASLTNVYKYAASFYPLAISELEVGQAYVRQMQELSSTSSPQAAALLNTIQTAISAADADIERTTPYPKASTLVPEALSDKAVLQGQLARLGLLDPKDAEATFASAISAFGSANLPQSNDSYTRYYNALFLARMYGKSRASDITSLLAPLSTSEYASTAAVAYLASIANASVPQQSGAKLLAGIDPDFKTLLLNLGWHASAL